MNKNQWQGYLFVAPALILFSVFLLKPMVDGIQLSFFEAGLPGKSFVGLENYVKMLNNPLFWISIKNTLWYVAIAVPVKIVLSLGIALMLYNRYKIVQSLFRGLFYLPTMSAGVAMTVVWWWMFNPLYGPLNYLLSLVGIPPIYWLGSISWAKLAVIFILMNWTVGFGIILYLSALSGIPKGIYEAARIDGANSLQRLVRVTIPLITPITVFLLVTTTIGVIQIWQIIYLLTGGGPAYSTLSIAYQVFQLGFVQFKFGQASAYATILLMLTFSVAYFQFKWLNRKVEF